MTSVVEVLEPQKDRLNLTQANFECLLKCGTRHVDATHLLLFAPDRVAVFESSRANHQFEISCSGNVGCCDGNQQLRAGSAEPFSEPTITGAFTDDWTFNLGSTSIVAPR